MHIDASGRRAGDNAKLKSEQFILTSPQSHCVYFWFHMLGADIGTLNVYAVHDNRPSSPIWTRSGELGDYWSQGRATIDGTLGNFNVSYQTINAMKTFFLSLKFLIKFIDVVYTACV